MCRVGGRRRETSSIYPRGLGAPRLVVFQETTTTAATNMSPPVSPPLMSEIEGAPRVDRPTIWAGFQAAVASSPTALALACAHQPAALFSLSGGAAQQQHPYLRWTFAELHEGVHRVVAAWRALGVREGSMLVTFAQNSAEWTLAL